jgi:hypothetical protein
MGVLKNQEPRKGFKLVEHIARHTRRGVEYKEKVVKRSPEHRSATSSPRKRKQSETSFTNHGMDDADMLPRMESPFKKRRYHRVTTLS